MRARARDASVDAGGGRRPSSSMTLRPPEARGHTAHLAGLQNAAGNAAVALGIQRMPQPGGGRCACGGTPGPDGECAACRARRLAGQSVQRAPQSPGAPAPAPPARVAAPPDWLVEDGTEELGPGQATKTAWLSDLRVAICDRAEKEMAGTPNSTEGCPFIGFWIGYFAGRPASEVGSAALRYAPELAAVTSATQAIGPIVDRVGAAVAIWVRTGQITGIPEGAGAGLGRGEPGAGAEPGVQRKGRGGAGPAGPGGGAGERSAGAPDGGGAGTEPTAVLASLGDGRPLDSGLRARMEPLFGRSFSAVRVHTDSGAASLSAGLDARAFTVGHHIALGPGEYQPGTIAGDALLAHELAHVVQQAGASRTAGPLRDGSPAYEAFEQDADVSAAGAVATLWGGAKAAVAAGLAGALPRMRAGLAVQRCRRTVYHCPKGMSWKQLPQPIGAGAVCICAWKCQWGEEGDYVAPSGGYSGQSYRCPANMNCDTGKPREVEIPEDTVVKGEDGIERKYSSDVTLAPGAHFTPLTGDPMCGCLPLDVEGDPKGTERTYTPRLSHPGLEVTDLTPGRAAKAMGGLGGTRGGGANEPVLPRRAPMTQEPPPAVKRPTTVPEPPPAVKTPTTVPEPPPAVKTPTTVPEPPPAVKTPTTVPEPPPAVKTPTTVPEPPPAVKTPTTVPEPPRAAPAAPPAPRSTPRTLAAEQRVTETQAAHTAASRQATAARAKVAKAEGDLQAARALAAEPGAGAEGAKLVRQAQADLKSAQAELQPLVRSEATARSEAAASARGRAEVIRLEAEIASLDARMSAELNPPGGFTKEQLAEGRRPGVIPLPEARLQPSGAKYHDLARQRAASTRQLLSETEGLTRTLAEQVAAATPGAAARPDALRNAASLDAPLRPVNGVPIDVTTGKPMTSVNPPTDHLMSRTEIARDPRFARLTPLQRDAMLLEVPENYLPLTREANSSKGGLSVDAWIAARAASKQPLPAEVATALRAADKRARAAVEAKFNQFLPK